MKINRLMLALPVLFGQAQVVYAWPSEQVLAILDNVQSQISRQETVIQVLEQQNQAHRLLPEAEKQKHHIAWAKELGDYYSPMMAKISNSEISELLWDVQIENESAFAQVIIVDAGGLIAGQSIVSPNYRVDHDMGWKEAIETGESTIDEVRAIYPLKNINSDVVGAVIYHFEIPNYIRYTAHTFQY